MPLDAGALTARIQLERDVVTHDHGAERRTSEVYASVWAQPEALSGREAGEGSTVAWRFTLRWRTDVRPQHRIIYAGRRYEIRAVLPDLARRDKVVLMCEAMDG